MITIESNRPFNHALLSICVKIKRPFPGKFHDEKIEKDNFQKVKV